MPLTQDRNTHQRDGEMLSLSVAAGAVIYAGALVVLNASGMAAPGSTATGLTYVGRADESVDNSAGADGDATVTVRRKTAFKWKNQTGDLVTEAGLLKTCYIVDDETVAATDGTGTRSAAGTVIGIDSDGVWVE
ncbi:hypothetical protein [Thiomicrorhabdus cannonii]|uniref:hypothetical protein n=1 Tax=Thiomicrorhabdus cannonii TaxID=2748011 RepID=UPI0015B8BD5E|nr:hypothetical protein [Thiomicrorhabdus cannonii]